jgi:hypothetical protein
MRDIMKSSKSIRNRDPDFSFVFLSNYQTEILRRNVIIPEINIVPSKPIIQNPKMSWPE